jgi:Ca2+-binding EF-hand superfamily protein
LDHRKFEDAKAAFQAFDVHKNKRLSYEDLGRGLFKLNLNLLKEEVNAVAKHLDTKHTGHIT